MISDFVAVPAFPGTLDLRPTLETVESVVGPYAVLLNRVGRAVTVDAEFTLHLQNAKANILDSAIPETLAFQECYGGQMKDHLYDYEMVAEEIQEMLHNIIDVALGTNETQDLAEPQS